MSIKLVVDNGEAIELGGLGITAELRDLASHIEIEHPTASRAILIVESDAGLTRFLVGPDMTGNELVGMLEQVKFWAIENGE
jgi:hypothetical protein